MTSANKNNSFFTQYHDFPESGGLHKVVAAADAKPPAKLPLETQADDKALVTKVEGVLFHKRRMLILPLDIQEAKRACQRGMDAGFLPRKLRLPHSEGVASGGSAGRRGSVTRSTLFTSPPKRRPLCRCISPPPLRKLFLPFIILPFVSFLFSYSGMNTLTP